MFSRTPRYMQRIQQAVRKSHSRETSPKYVKKKIHIFQKNKREKKTIPCVIVEIIFCFTEEIFNKMLLKMQKSDV